MRLPNKLLWLVPALLLAAPAAVADPHIPYGHLPPGYHPGGLHPWHSPAGLHPWYLRYHDVPDWFERRDSVTLQAGDTAAANRAKQMVDPWPPYVQNRHIEYNGVVIDGAFDRYKALGGGGGGGGGG